MSESAKTLIFVAIAATTMAIAFLAKPTSAVYDVSKQIGTMLTDDFDPERAKRLTIVKFNEETATLREFKVAEEAGVWTIPSKGGYPADAFRQMAEAATGATGREILSIASESAADHERFGVVDPRSPKLDVAQSGVGVRVTLADEDDDPLADLIIGKQVKDEDDQHYVRRQNQDVVYVVQIDPEKFSTDFSDWIEDDLLQVNASDIERVRINDYSFELTVDGLNAYPQWDRRGDYTLRYDDSESKWVAEQLRGFSTDGDGAAAGDTNDYEEITLGGSQSLDQDALRELRDALDDLRIVDVDSKPSGLSGSLKVEEDFVQKLDRAGVASLYQRGFAPIPIRQGGPVEVQSSEGEVIVTMKDGVEYVLRFGDVESSGEEAGVATTDNNAENDADEDAGSGVNRYLFVVTRFNDSVIEKPEFEELPEEDPPAEKDEDAGTDAASADRETEADIDSPAEDPADGTADDTANDDSSEDRPAGNEQADPTDDSGAAEEGDESPSTEEETATDAERDAIIRRNQEKQDAYEGKIAEGRKRVEELNERFGDWYYVVSDSVYSKIRLSRDDFIKSDEKDTDGEAGDDPTGEDASVLGAPGQPVPGLPAIDLETDPQQ